MRTWITWTLQRFPVCADNGAPVIRVEHPACAGDGVSEGLTLRRTGRELNESCGVSMVLAPAKRGELRAALGPNGESPSTAPMVGSSRIRGQYVSAEFRLQTEAARIRAPVAAHEEH